jgi:hypothetical protein
MWSDAKGFQFPPTSSEGEQRDKLVDNGALVLFALLPRGQRSGIRRSERLTAKPAARAFTAMKST